MKSPYESASFLDEMFPGWGVGAAIHGQMMKVLKRTQGNLGYRPEAATT
jgi:hypothetical protein